MGWSFSKVAVVGSGAIGLYYGGRLAAAGEDVRFLLRSDLDAARRDGLRVESIDGDFAVADVKGFASPEEIGPADLVIIAWKATSNHQLDTILPPLLHAGTRVLTLQNGLGNCERIAEVVSSRQVLGGLCFVCCNRLAPATVSHTAGGRISLASWRGDPAEAAEIASRFQMARIPANAVADLERAQWEKLVWNIPFNGLSIAEGGKTTDELLAVPEMENEIRALMHEVISAARAQEMPLDDSLVAININRTRPMGPYRTSSMIDFVEGREVEVGPIWEEPLRRASAAGVAMPRLSRLLGCIRQRLAERDATTRSRPWGKHPQGS